MTRLHRWDLYFLFRKMRLQEDKASDCLNFPPPIPNPLHLLRLFPGIISFREPSRIEHLKLGLVYSLIPWASLHLRSCALLHMHLFRDLISPHRLWSSWKYWPVQLISPIFAPHMPQTASRSECVLKTERWWARVEPLPFWPQNPASV